MTQKCRTKWQNLIKGKKKRKPEEDVTLRKIVKTNLDLKARE